MKSKGSLVLGLLCAFAIGPPPALSQEGYEFMPKGGKALLLQMVGEPLHVAALQQIVETGQSEEEWRAALAEQKGVMSDRELPTLANYLAVNMPLAEGVLAQAESAGDISVALPPDGRELAWNNCQFCHSLFTGYLTQDRDARGWLGTFEVPFHREIEMTVQEQETFARYSAINMPMTIEEVPAELRF